MTGPYLRLTAEPHARPDDVAAIEHAVTRHNMALANDWSYCRAIYFLRDDADRIHGGLTGGMWGGWLHLAYIWVADGLRHQGYGTTLLAAAEDEARAKGCRGVYVHTYDFQSRPFFEHRGYEVVGEIADYPAGHTFYLMRKLLAPAP